MICKGLVHSQHCHDSSLQIDESESGIDFEAWQGQLNNQNVNPRLLYYDNLSRRIASRPHKNKKTSIFDTNKQTETTNTSHLFKSAPRDPMSTLRALIVALHIPSGQIQNYGEDFNNMQDAVSRPYWLLDRLQYDLGAQLYCHGWIHPRAREPFFVGCFFQIGAADGIIGLLMVMAL